VKFVLFFLFLIFPILAGAEYRAYKLSIGKPDSDQREVVTTLDHIQYPGYYPVNTGEVVKYVDSWMCWGRTEGFDSICEQPALPPAPEKLPTPSAKLPPGKPTKAALPKKLPERKPSSN
jgi:hypothetical protein